MINVQNISFSYAHNEVLKDISFDVAPGECVGILGNNGAGKSTLITCLNRIRKPKTGALYMDGQDMLKVERRKAAQFISYVAQKSEGGQMTVFDAVLLGRKPYFNWALSDGDIAACEDAVNNIGLGDLKLRYLNELSGGELQKTMLARALAGEPKLMLLDEPTSSLDPKNQCEVMELVRTAAKEKSISVIMVIHDLSLALRYCDKFLFIKSGLVYKYGDAQVITEETISVVYGVKSTIAEVNGRKIVVVG
ncbi:MAG: ABC transporter ATP-binding protein [Spirochaetes bacterium]|nr:ABC transporter ATP-binding protein [Spirochaetota bacterium]